MKVENISIPSHPNEVGLTRKADLVQQFWKPDLYAKMVIDVKSLDSEGNIVKTVQKETTASLNNMVDPLTGIRIVNYDPEVDTTAVPEYVFFENLPLAAILPTVTGATTLVEIMAALTEAQITMAAANGLLDA